AVCSASTWVMLETVRLARRSARSCAVRASQIAEATLIATSTSASATSARVREMRERRERGRGCGMGTLPDGGSEELHDCLQKVRALYGLGEGTVGAGGDRRFGAEALARAEVAGHGDERDAGVRALQLADRFRAARAGHEHV